MNIRLFQPNDVSVITNLFRDTVRRVCSADYEPQQILAWASIEIDADEWIGRFSNSFTVVAEEGSVLLGFANLERNGNVDMLYVHADWQGKGVGKLLFGGLEREAKKTKLQVLTSDVSITARQFFLKMGFGIEKEYIKEFRGSTFVNTKMFKVL